MKLSRDKNGNKTLKITKDDLNYRGIGFSIQTNGNLPLTHKMNKYDFDNNIAMNELLGFVRKYGTKKQKETLNID